MPNYVYLVQCSEDEDGPVYGSYVVAIASSVKNAIKAVRADYKARIIDRNPNLEYREHISKTKFYSGKPLLLVYKQGVYPLYDLYYGIVCCEVDDPYYLTKSPDYNRPEDIDSTWLDELNLDELKEE